MRVHICDDKRLFVDIVCCGRDAQAITAGMRLEAVDRKNPHLVCVATVAAVDTARPDPLLIHFDGWSDRCAALCDGYVVSVMTRRLYARC